MFKTVVEYALSFSSTLREKKNINGEFMKIFEEVSNQKVLSDDGPLRAVCDTCRYRIETSWKRNCKL